MRVDGVSGLAHEPVRRMTVNEYESALRRAHLLLARVQSCFLRGTRSAELSAALDELRPVVAGLPAEAGSRAPLVADLRNLLARLEAFDREAGIRGEGRTPHNAFESAAPTDDDEAKDITVPGMRTS